MKPLWQAIARYVREHRKRIASLVLVVAILVIGGQVLAALPRTVEIRYDLGPDHGAVTEARILYLHEGAEVKGVQFRYAGGAPEAVRHTVELSPGRYDVWADLRGPGVRRTIVRGLDVPADGLVRIDLYDGEDALARVVIP